MICLLSARSAFGVTVALVGLVIAAGTVRSAGADETGLGYGVEQLKKKVDPAFDDWPTEVQHVRAKHVLEHLADTLVGQYRDSPPGVAAFFTPQAALNGLRPAAQAERLDGYFSLSRIRDPSGSNGVMVSPDRAFESLLAAFRACDRLRIEFKIIGVEPGTDNRFDTEVLYQAYGEGSGLNVQQNATWRVTWRQAHERTDPLLHSIKVAAFDEISTPKRQFLDCTRSVITEAGTWHPQLALGSDYWYGRIDAVGEVNFMGHEGLAVGDVNGDGLDDLYVAMGQGLPNKLFVQQPDGTVRDTAHQAGVDWLDATKGVLLVDLDNDGDQDLLCAMGPTVVYCRNDGTGQFTPYRSLKASTPAAFYSLAAADYDLDGDLDVYATRYVNVRYGVSVPIPFHDANNGPRNHLLRNDGAAGFTDVTQEVGLDANNARFSLAAAWIDFDGDGDADLYVANDFGRNNLYRNDGGRFVDVAAETGTEDQAAGMGVSWADFDLDGDDDLYVSNMFSSAGRRIAYQPAFMQGRAADDREAVRRHSLGNTLLLNQRAGGAARFRDVSEQAGVRMGRWAWGAKFADINNDAYADLVVPNGFLTNQRKDDL